MTVLREKGRHLLLQPGNILLALALVTVFYLSNTAAAQQPKRQPILTEQQVLDIGKGKVRSGQAYEAIIYVLNSLDRVTKEYLDTKASIEKEIEVVKNDKEMSEEDKNNLLKDLVEQMAMAYIVPPENIQLVQRYLNQLCGRRELKDYCP